MFMFMLVKGCFAKRDCLYRAFFFLTLCELYK
jgi:hypothetical protein